MFVRQTSLFIHALRFLSNFIPNLSNISDESFSGHSILLPTQEIDFPGAVLLEILKSFNSRLVRRISNSVEEMWDFSRPSVEAKE